MRMTPHDVSSTAVAGAPLVRPDDGGASYVRRSPPAVGGSTCVHPSGPVCGISTLAAALSAGSDPSAPSVLAADSPPLSPAALAALEASAGALSPVAAL